MVEYAYARDGYGKALVELGERYKNVVVLCADLAESTRAQWFKEKFPDRYIEMGVAEQNMMGVAAGMSFLGKIPFVSSYAVFSPGRNWDQLRVSVCYSKANVKVIGAHSGISVGPDGATHQALEDVAMVRALPNLTVIVPADIHETKKAVIAAALLDGPVYIRFGREKVPIVTDEKSRFMIGKAEIMREGNDCVVYACGQQVYEALEAADELSKHGISVMVVNNHTIKPIDRHTVIEAAKKCGCAVTAEEHQVHGGMGSAVAEVLSEHHPVPIRFVGMPDTFGESGKPQELLQKYGMLSSDIKEAVLEVVKLKSSQTETIKHVQLPKMVCTHCEKMYDDKANCPVCNSVLEKACPNCGMAKKDCICN